MLPIQFIADPDLDLLVNRAVERTLAVAGPKIKVDDLGVALGQVDRAKGTIRWGGLNFQTKRYPASTVKLFYLAYAEHLIAGKKLKSTPELRRAMKDMIVESVNDATGLVLESITGTTGGPELAPAALRTWMNKRQAVNRWFTDLGYEGVNACQKTWNEGPYGRERQGYGPNFELRNALTPYAGMRLLSEIMLDRIVNPTACAAMRDLLKRSKDSDAQYTGFVGGLTAPGTEVWSKAGWTTTTKHDLAWIRTADGREVVLAVFTVNDAASADVLPTLASELLKGLGVPLRKKD